MEMFTVLKFSFFSIRIEDTHSIHNSHGRVCLNLFKLSGF